MLENNLKKNLNKLKEIQQFVTNIEDVIKTLKTLDKDMNKLFYSNEIQNEKELKIQDINEKKDIICASLSKKTEYMLNTVTNMKNSLDIVCKSVYVSDGVGHIVRQLNTNDIDAVQNTENDSEFITTSSPKMSDIFDSDIGVDSDECINKLKRELFQIIG